MWAVGTGRASSPARLPVPARAASSPRCLLHTGRGEALPSTGAFRDFYLIGLISILCLRGPGAQERAGGGATCGGALRTQLHLTGTLFTVPPSYHGALTGHRSPSQVPIMTKIGISRNYQNVTQRLGRSLGCAQTVPVPGFPNLHPAESARPVAWACNRTCSSDPGPAFTGDQTCGSS